MDWKEREAMRFQTGVYQPVPWASEPWAEGLIEHYAHVSTDNPALMAYTTDEDAGNADLQVRTKPGRYLQKFAPHLTTKDLQYWAGRFLAETKGEDALLFALKPEEIVWVYRNGPSSCMSHGLDAYNTDGIHPTYVYGAGDLAVAYVLEEGKPVARTICWPEKMIYSRIYGYEHLLERLLHNKGWKRGYSAQFEGARLLRINATYRGGDFICPYVDCYDYFHDNGDFLVLSQGGGAYGHCAGRTDGIAVLDCHKRCQECGEFVSGLDTVRVAENEYWEVCDECRCCLIEEADGGWCPSCTNFVAIPLHQRDYRSVCEWCEPPVEEEEEPEETPVVDERQGSFVLTLSPNAQMTIDYYRGSGAAIGECADPSCWCHDAIRRQGARNAN